MFGVFGVPLAKDAKLQQYVNRVGRWVTAQSERPGLNWHFGVIDTNDLNAFAAPGGYIFVTKGLYRVLQNESELAAVLAHEIGHASKNTTCKTSVTWLRMTIGSACCSRLTHILMTD